MNQPRNNFRISIHVILDLSISDFRHFHLGSSLRSFRPDISLKLVSHTLSMIPTPWKNICLVPPKKLWPPDDLSLHTLRVAHALYVMYCDTRWYARVLQAKNTCLFRRTFLFFRSLASMGSCCFTLSANEYWSSSLSHQLCGVRRLLFILKMIC